MKIPVHYSLKVARKIASKINLPREIAKDCTISSWSNGREQGLCIDRFVIGGSPKVVFAQHRSSDNILVIGGKGETDFDFQTNQPSDTVWGTRVHFRYDEVDKAVKYIEKFLTNAE